MRLSKATRLGVVLAGGALLVHCGGFRQSLVPPAASPGLRTTPNQSARSQDRHRQSWMVKGIGQRDLLYVSNANGTVNVYTYWQRRLVGVLTNFARPLGECSDKSGNVYIVDNSKKKVFEYAHGGKKPIKVLSDAPYFPFGCSVAPASGNLAVANDPYYSYYAKGNVAVYPHGGGTPKIYYGTTYNDHFNSVAYNDRGDLLTTSTYGYLNFYTEFYYLPRGGSSLILMNLPPPYGSGWDYVQGVAFDGRYWLVLSFNTIYQFKINIKAQLVGSVKLYGGYSDSGPIAVYRKSLESVATQVVGANGTSNKSAAEYWYYPAGGNPYATVTKGLDQPYGTAISLAPQ